MSGNRVGRVLEIKTGTVTETAFVQTAAYINLLGDAWRTDAAGFTYDEVSRKHTLNGRPVKSVTQIIRGFSYFGRFGNNTPDNIKYAAERGTAVHTVCAQYDMGMEPSGGDPRIEPYFEAWRKFRRETGVHFPDPQKSIEVPMVASDGSYCGKIDRITCDGDRYDPMVVNLLDDGDWKVIVPKKTYAYYLNVFRASQAAHEFYGGTNELIEEE